MAEIFLSYWEASARFAIFALLLIAATPLLKRFVPANLLYWAWGILLLRLLLPLSIPMGESIFSLHGSVQPSAWTEALRRGVVEAGWGETILPVFRDQEQWVVDTQIGVSWRTALVSIWLMGALVMSLGLLRNILRLHRFFGKAERQVQGSLYELFKDTRRRYGIHANVPLLVSDEIKTPGIAGVFNPRIVLPRQCVEQLSDRELRCIFLHELTHYRRGDMFVHHALLIVCYLHWFNPVVWLALRQFKLAMEQACDASVLDSDCLSTAQDYGLTLLSVHSFSARNASPAGALCLLGNRRSGALKERIRLIARPRRIHPLAAAAGLCVFGTAFLYAIGGEGDSQSETSRLLKLTRLTQPLFSKGASNLDTEKPWGRDLSVGSENFAMPNAWVNNLDVSRYLGTRAQFEVSMNSRGDMDELVFWACVSDANGRTLSLQSQKREIQDYNDDMALFDIEVVVPDEAVEFCYGFAIRGNGQAWVERMEIVASPLEIAFSDREFILEKL